MKGEAKTLYEAIRQDLIRLHANWELYKQLFTVSEDRYTVFNETAPAFFRLLQDLLVDNAVVSLSRLTDPAHYESLSRLVKVLRSQVKHGFYEEFRHDLIALESACTDIREHRHKRVAHKALKSQQPKLSESSARLPPLTRKKIEGAMASMAALMNKILGYFEDVEQYYIPVMRGDGNTLFFFLEKGYGATRSTPYPASGSSKSA